ncbi:MAG TPA: TonB-dependent receptor [Candidatus Acidoferrum sp.]|nr:TonB-dependent receptor [Candidatus Acidoferrum sp.]
MGVSAKNVLRSATLLLHICLLSLVYGQIRSGTITGSVKDATGAMIPNAEVTLVQVETNITAKSKTTDSGQFTFPYLAAGSYTVTIAAPGFAAFRETGLNVGTAQTVRVDAELKVSNVDASVEVHAEAATIQTDSTSVTGALQARAIDAIPNITQNPLYYAFLQNGVVPRNAATATTGDNSFGIGVNGRRQFSAVGINGGRAFTNDIQLDGLPVMGGGYNEAAVIPNTEGLQEVRVISNNFSAEYGRGQGVVSMSTKSGTNGFHGQATYTIRNEALNANTNSNNANGSPRGAFKSHEWGGAVAGPIIKNKLFFSSSYHYLMFNRGVTNLSTVPTDLERNGNFSQTLIRETTGLPVAAAIFNPFSVVQQGPDLFQRTPYPNAIVTNDSPAFGAAVYMDSFYPKANRTPDDVYNTNNYSSSTIQTVRRQSLNNRLDYRWGKQSIYGSGGFGYGNVVTPRAFGTAPFNGAPNLTSDKNPYGQIGDTIVLSPTMVLDIRYGVTRINTKAFSGDKDGFTDYDKIGVPKNLQQYIQIFGAAPVVSTYSGGSGGGSNWTAVAGGNFGTKHEQQTSHVVSGSVTKSRGSWTHKFGGEFRNLLSNYSDLEEASVSMPSVSNSVGGNFVFQYTSATGAVAQQNTLNQQKGINGATPFTGAGLWWIRPGANLLAAFGQPYFAVYSQNDWRVSSKLTLNLGLRWDLQPGPTERYNRMAAYDLEAKNPFGATGAIAFPGTNGYSRGLWDTRYNNWGPRVGLAYQAKAGLVLRGGFGVTYLPSNTGYFSGPNDYGSTSFGSGTNMIPYGNNPNGVVAYRFTDPTPLSLAVGANVNDPSVYGVSEARFERHLKNGLSKQWNFFVEKAFARSWFVSAGYSGAASRNLSNRNQIFESTQNVPASVLDGWKQQYIASSGATNPANLLVPNPLQPASGPLKPFNGAIGAATVQQFVPYLPYPYLYGTGSRINDSRGFADFNSLQVRVSHAFAHGFQVDFNYTWSKELDYTSTATEDGQGFNSGGTAGAPDILNLYNNRRYGSADTPHRATAVIVYELPIGPGKALNPHNKVVSAIVGNWQAGSVITAQAGMPIIISGASDGSLVGRPHRIAGADLEVPKSLQKWYDGVTQVTLPCGRTIVPAKNTFLKYNACAFDGPTILAPNGKYISDVYFVGPAAQDYGDFRGPGRFNIDMSLRRTFRVREHMSLNLNVDATNLLNSAQYSGAYNGGLGNTNLVDNPAKGLKVGMGTNDTFGTIGLGTFDPRQVTMRLLLRF